MRWRCVIALALSLVLSACSGDAGVQAGVPRIGFDEVTAGLERPIMVVHAGDGSGHSS